jgi:alpha-D-ribose 1-methylphosphonate 5-triphosphate diphosphatase
MSDILIRGGRVLLGEALVHADVAVRDGRIAAAATSGAVLDAEGLLVLPGIVDLHGDAFERQLQPRPGVDFPVDVALVETEAQLLANGITTAFHGITLSWEPGLRSVAAWSAWLDALDRHRPRALCDMRVHLRWEAFNLEALAVALADIAAGRVHLLAFNDHTPSILRRLDDPAKAAKYVERGPLSAAAFRDLAYAVAARADEVPAALARIAAAGRDAGLPMASHDDATVADRDLARDRGARICEFPMTEAVAQAAQAAGDFIVMGAPNVLRGGSHLGWASAAVMAERGLCTVLGSDYYYPALLQAPFILERRGQMSLAQAWALVSANPAAAAGFSDRGTLEIGQRADVVIVAPDARPRLVASIAGGRLAWTSAEGAERCLPA